MEQPADQQSIRELRNLIEPIAAAMYFDAKSQQALTELGLSYDAGYICSRSSCLGRVSPQVVAAAFGTINPGRISRALQEGWATTTPEILLEARRNTAGALFRRLLGSEPDGLSAATQLLLRAAASIPFAGHPMFAALRSVPVPEDSLAALWFAADTLREHRGDSHVVAWTSAGLHPTEIYLLTGLWLGRDVEERMESKGWTEAEVRGARERLTRIGLLGASGLTERGRALRDKIERRTSLQEEPVLAAWSAAEFEELRTILTPVRQKIVEAGVLPADILQPMPA